jgi:hypothetical protein
MCNIQYTLKSTVIVPTDLVVILSSGDFFGVSIFLGDLSSSTPLSDEPSE